MAYAAPKALPLAPRLKCPDWCTHDHVDPDEDTITHLRLSEPDIAGRVIVIGQTDEPMGVEEPEWHREDATISIATAETASGTTDRLHDHDILELTPRQAYALAALVGDQGNESLAALLLDAVDKTRRRRTR